MFMLILMLIVFDQVVVESPWLRVLEQLPDPLPRKKYAHVPGKGGRN
jgi:hypothetical protein